MGLGPVMIALSSAELTAEEREMLLHPLVGGVTLFSRNFSSPEQVANLTAEIHRLRDPQLIIAVDQEGGRVQRFREGFTRLPPARCYGEIYDKNPERGLHVAEMAGWVMASELRAVGIDISFAPVLDIDRNVSSVIGDRAFHQEPKAVAALAGAFSNGMQRAGMAATGKHFPGHGGIEADSHVAVCIDERFYNEIYQDDIYPFQRLIKSGLAAIMVAHVLYPNVDKHLAGFSKFWLQEVLRRRLRFQGIIISDDLEMEGANLAGGIADRAQAAMAAGCDIVLVCHEARAMAQVLDCLENQADPVRALRMSRLHARHPFSRAELLQNQAWKEAVALLQPLEEERAMRLI